jgi:hypothetical protein
MLSCGCRFDEDWPDMVDDDENDDDDHPRSEPMGVDGNGLLVERTWLGGQEVIVHRDDLPASDITTVQGIRCTTPLRTIIDLAPQSTTAQLEQMLRDSLERKLFTVEEAWQRVAQPDMASRRGAALLRQVLPPLPD